MVWWLFKKKEVVPEHHHIQTRVDTIEQGVKSSFSNIRKDILHLFSKIDRHDKELQSLKQKLILLEQTKEPEEREEIIKEIQIEAQKSTVSWEDLTSVQQTLFKRLAVLQVEGTQKWIAMKTLAEELYPNKPYNSVRSMISDYIHLLIDLGLVKKTRKRRQVYVSLSKVGSNFFNKSKQKKLLQVLEKAE